LSWLKETSSKRDRTECDHLILHLTWHCHSACCLFSLSWSFKLHQDLVINKKIINKQLIWKGGWGNRDY